MKREIIFTSSYSSQLGALISLSKYFEKNNLWSHKKNILVIHIRTKGDISCNYSCFEEYGRNILGQNSYIRVIKINNILKRLVLLIFLSTIKILGLNNYLSAWEPSPNWLKRLFNYRNINLNLFKNYFHNIKYYGDGFLCLSETSIPFWLNKEKLSIEIKNNSKKNIFYYFYDLNISKNKKYKYIKIDPSYIKNILEKLIIKSIITTNKKQKNLIIFPLTTFFETNRSTLESEINLYIDYLNKTINNKKDPLLIKPHPGNLEIKEKRLIKRLQDENFNIVNNQFKKNQIIKLPLKIIPLELLCLILVKKMNFNEKDIRIAINSNATLSTSYLFPEIICLKPFGKKLIYKYIKQEYIKKRIIQEEILIKKIYKNKI
tara:strand:+ start:1428 stop:2552 length:1125 start_codon:yes stop_codon:yes gene_type:complete